MHKIERVTRILLEKFSKPIAEREMEYLSSSLPRYVNTLNLIPKSSGNKVALDIGTGYGHLAFLMKELCGYQVVAADVEMSDYIKERLINYQIKPRQAGFEAGKSLPFRDSSFDLVLFAEVLEHLLIPPREVFLEIHRILKIGGAMVCTTPNICRIDSRLRLLVGKQPQLFLWGARHGVSDPRGHFREWSMEELGFLLKDLFLIKETKFISSVGKLGLVKERKKFKVLYYPYKFLCFLWPSFRDTLAMIGIKK